MAKKTPSPAQAWKRLEKHVLQTLGEDAAGTYPEALEPRALAFPHAFDDTPLLPPDYLAFVKALGYRWLSTGDGALAFPPPRWRLHLSQQMGEPERAWTEVRAEREAGTHTYRFVMFASHDINDTNGYAFGPSAEGGARVVWTVEDSLPVEECGAFPEWLEHQMRELEEALARHEAGDGEAPEGDPLGLEGESLPLRKKRPQAKGPEAVLAAFDRTEKELTLNGRKLGELPPLIGEFSALEHLWLGSTGLKHLPRELGQLRALKRLDLSFNRELSALPQEVGQLQCLESLNLRATRLASLPDELGQLPRLRFLSLEASAMTSVPPCLFHLKSLRTLDFHAPAIPREQLEALRQALPDCAVGIYP
ncbi:leucine-rich repeat domain-containing protein [Melittangium boletus]|uniref:leucine-rich repeat domain-containing protein n=1 Tax=Melittangium boletus TaxID=83453 RepID=UPI003DA26222